MSPKVRWELRLFPNCAFSLSLSPSLRVLSPSQAVYFVYLARFVGRLLLQHTEVRWKWRAFFRMYFCACHLHLIFSFCKMWKRHHNHGMSRSRYWTPITAPLLGCSMADPLLQPSEEMHIWMGTVCMCSQEGTHKKTHFNCLCMVVISCLLLSTT